MLASNTPTPSDETFLVKLLFDYSSGVLGEELVKSLAAYRYKSLCEAAGVEPEESGIDLERLIWFKSSDEEFESETWKNRCFELEDMEAARQWVEEKDKEAQIKLEEINLEMDRLAREERERNDI